MPKSKVCGKIYNQEYWYISVINATCSLIEDHSARVVEIVGYFQETGQSSKGCYKRYSCSRIL